MNDFCKVKIRTTEPIKIGSYRESRTTESITLIDDTTNETVVVGMIA